MVLSSGSLVRPCANADWKTLSPSVRNRATRASVPPPVTPPNTPAAIGAEIAAAAREVEHGPTGDPRRGDADEDDHDRDEHEPVLRAFVRRIEPDPDGRLDDQ